jgi:hypothetical protein
MTYNDVVALWNAQADEFNQWDLLSLEEQVEWALECRDEELVIQTVDSCFHTFASSYREEAKEMAKKILSTKEVL